MVDFKQLNAGWGGIFNVETSLMLSFFIFAPLEISNTIVTRGNGKFYRQKSKGNSVAKYLLKITKNRPCQKKCTTAHRHAKEHTNRVFLLLRTL